MFGPYEIEIGGRGYFCNVSPRESHVFNHDGQTYVYDVERMTARPIPPGLAGVIDRLSCDAGALVPESVMRALRELHLVAGDEDAPADTPTLAPAPDAEAKKPSFPVSNIALFVVQTCNMRCLYCYGKAGEYGGQGMMDEGTALRAVDWLMENSGSKKKVGISFFGGEPLLNFPLMRKITPYARQKAAEAGKEMRFDMTTNGSLITDEVIAFIKDENIHPMISFDGPPEVQNRQRPFRDGSGSYDTVAANIRKLRRVLPGLSARATLLGDADPFRIREGVEQAGFATCFLAPASPILLGDPVGGGNGDGNGNGTAERRLAGMLSYHRQEAATLLAAIRERRIDKDAPPSSLGYLEVLLAEEKRHYGCGIGKAMAAIAVNGDIYPCHRFVGLTETRLGNIAEYKAGAANDYHRAIVDSLPECLACWARYLCGGGCFYHNKAVTGDMRRHSDLDCRERRAMFEGLVHVQGQLGEADRTYVREILRDILPGDRHP